MQEEATPDQRARLAYIAAIRLLAPRGHSVAEIEQKLRQREHQPDAIANAVQELLDANYLNDEEYAALYAEQRLDKGYGPLAIRAKLIKPGVDKHYIQNALALLNADWTECVTALIHKRFNATDILEGDQRTTARIARFLHSRGFSSRDAVRGLNFARLEMKKSAQIDH